jgi:hypothetical protein
LDLGTLSRWGFPQVRLDTVRPVEVDGEKYYNLC